MAKKSKSNYKIAVIPADGIGPEVTAEAMKVLLAAAEKEGVSFELVEYDFGGDRYLKTGEILGIMQQNPNAIFQDISRRVDIDSNKIEKMLKERNDARARKDWTRADTIRDQLKEMGVVLEDTPQGTKWRMEV